MEGLGGEALGTAVQTTDKESCCEGAEKWDWSQREVGVEGGLYFWDEVTVCLRAGGKLLERSLVKGARIEDGCGGWGRT